MLKVQVDGKLIQPAQSVVLYDDSTGEDIPVAVAINHAGVVYFADSIRDVSEFLQTLAYLGVQPTRLHSKLQGTLQGNVR